MFHVRKTLRKKNQNETELTPEEIRRIANVQAMVNLPMYNNTSDFVPGWEVYTIEKIKPTKEIPYATFRPVPRIIVEIRDTGVNNGTTFLTQKPFVTQSIGQNNEIQVDTEEEYLFSPLTKEQAQFICDQLNDQTKLFYNKQMAKRQQIIDKQIQKG